MGLRFIPEDMDWRCEPCGVPLVPIKVVLTYLGSSFHVELPGCPKCGQVMIEESLAEGKITEVEQLLEDK